MQSTGGRIAACGGKNADRQNAGGKNADGQNASGQNAALGVSVTMWSAQWSGGCPLGRHHDEGGVEARMSMACVPGTVGAFCVL